MPHDRAHRLADAAFAEIALIHDLMSFQEPTSELSRINRDASRGPITVHPRTRECLARALELAERSGGVFDPVRTGGSWRDIRIGGDQVRTIVPLAIDLSGIAKGYAVDRACDVLRTGGAAAAMVNAGGDLCVFGGGEESVVLRPGGQAEPAVLYVADGAVASSDTASDDAAAEAPRHFDGRDGAGVRDGFATVCAPRCIDADALTKVVLALGEGAAPLLDAHQAIAHVHDARGWRTIGAVA